MTKDSKQVVLEIPSEMAFLKVAQDFADQMFGILQLNEQEKMRFLLS